MQNSSVCDEIGYCIEFTGALPSQPVLSRARIISNLRKLPNDFSDTSVAMVIRDCIEKRWIYKHHGGISCRKEALLFALDVDTVKAACGKG